MPSSDKTPQTNIKKSGIVQPGLIAFGVALLIVTLLYLRVLFNGLVWDDTYLIAEFGKMRQSGSLLELLTTPFWDNSAFLSAKLSDYWRPLTTGLLWLSGNLLSDSAASYHLVSLVAAVMASLVLCRIFLQILPQDRPFSAKWLALLFACHPLIAEVISMAANAADHLTFALVSLNVLLYLRIFAGRTSRLDYLLLFAFSFLACCAKELGVIAVAAAPVAALLYWAKGSDRPWRSLKTPIAWLPSVSGVVLYLVLRTIVISRSGLAALDLSSFGAYVSYLFFGFGQNLYSVVVPAPRGAHTYLDTSRVAPYLVSAIAWSVAITSAALVIRGRHTFKWPLIGFTISLGLLAPSLLTLTDHTLAMRIPTRYFHVPMAGFLIAAIPVVVKLPRRLVTTLGFISVLLLTSLSWIRVDDWHDEYSFYTAEARHNPDQTFELLNVIEAHLRQSKFGLAQAAIVSLEKHPSSTKPAIRASLLGYRADLAEMRDADYDRASALLEESLQANPLNLTVVFDLARVRYQAGHPEQSLVILEKALAAPWFQDRRRKIIENKIQLVRELSAASSEQNSRE